MNHHIKIKCEFNKTKQLKFLCEENGCLLYCTETVSTEQSLPELFKINLLDGMTGQLFMGFSPESETVCSGRLESYAGCEGSYAGSSIADGMIKEAEGEEGRHYICSFDGRIFEGYLWVWNTSPCMMIYEGGRQKALLSEEHFMQSEQSEMNLYILDESVKDIPLFCLWSLVYYQYEVMKKRGRILHGFSMPEKNIKEDGTHAEYHTEEIFSAAGKKMYHPEFMTENFPEVHMTDTVGIHSVTGQLEDGFKRVSGKVWTRENCRRYLLNKKIYILISICVIPFWLIFAAIAFSYGGIPAAVAVFFIAAVVTLIPLVLMLFLIYYVLCR